MIEAPELHRVIADLYEKHRNKAEISPAWLATDGMRAIGFPRTLHSLGYVGCHLQLRQIARHFCRAKCDPVDVVMQDDLFPETLQERYPLRPVKGEEPVYQRLELLSDDDLIYNEGRLRRASTAMEKHADALRAYRRNRRSHA